MVISSIGCERVGVVVSIQRPARDGVVATVERAAAVFRAAALPIRRGIETVQVEQPRHIPPPYRPHTDDPPVAQRDRLARPMRQ